VQVAEPSFAEEVGEAKTDSVVEFVSNPQRYAAEDANDVEEERVLTIEQTIADEPKDTREISTAKNCINELPTRKNQTRLCVARTKRCGGVQVFDERPGICDFAADIRLAGLRSLSSPLFKVFEWAMANDFERWPEVPRAVRDAILQRVGNALRLRKIVDGKGSTANYFSVGLRQRRSVCATM